jgi:uncharacterized membrane protein YkvA (DUF1232 family)
MTKSDHSPRAKDSESFQKAKRKAEQYASDPKKLGNLIDQATKKANKSKGRLKAVWDQLSACFRLIKAYGSGSYREIPWSSLVMIVASVIYFVMPIDMIPDVLVGFGLVDDAAVLGWTIRTFGSDIDDFIEWESTQTA